MHLLSFASLHCTNSAILLACLLRALGTSPWPEGLEAPIRGGRRSLSHKAGQAPHSEFVPLSVPVETPPNNTPPEPSCLKPRLGSTEVIPDSQKSQLCTADAPNNPNLAISSPPLRSAVLQARGSRSLPPSLSLCFALGRGGQAVPTCTPRSFEQRHPVMLTVWARLYMNFTVIGCPSVSSTSKSNHQILSLSLSACLLA